MIDLRTKYLPSLTGTKDEIHIWYAMLDDSIEQFEYYSQLLTAEEKNKAAGFRFKQSRIHFVLRRGILRTILGLYLAKKPNLVELRNRKNGKPELVPSRGTNSIQFSLSHSNGVALYGFTRECDIGVDIEYVRQIDDMELLSQSFFSQSENSTLQALPVEERKRAFFKCWTRKEAFIKATGEGLSYPLNSFEVSLGLNEPPSLLILKEDGGKGTLWSIGEPELISNVAAAFAIRGAVGEVQCWEWRDLSCQA